MKLVVAGVVRLGVLGILVQAIFSFGPIHAPVVAAEQVSGKRLLQQLIEGARKEGQLNVFLVDSLTERGSRELNDAFNRRFGLNVKFNASHGTASREFPKIIEEAKIGLPPSYDAIYTTEGHIFPMLEIEIVERIQNWEALLKEMSPEAYQVRDKVSPLDLSGYAFAWGTRAKVINYNPDLISETELPQTRKDLGSPKYEGAYFLPPFITEAEYGILFQPKDKWLEIVRSWSRWKPPILTYEAGLQRMFLGEFKFAPSNDYYQFKYKGRDPKTPIGLAFFKDLTPLTYAWNFVRKRARHPNTATLFVLWATSPEANRIFENLDYSATGNLLLGTGSMSRQINEALDKRKVKVLSWWDSRENQAALRWYATDEGRAYLKELSAAQTGRRR
jgi:Bacterial extracellular solute-binding protein